MTDDLIYEKARLIHEHGINTFLSTVYGTPGETGEQMMKTLDMVADIKPTQCSGNVFYPLPKTKLYDRAVEIGYLDEEGEEKVRLGLSSFHHESILNHPHKDLAETLATMTPIYVKSPDWAKPALRFMIEHKMKRLALALYIALIPFTFTIIGRDAIKITLAMAWKGIRGEQPGLPGDGGAEVPIVGSSGGRVSAHLDHEDDDGLDPDRFRPAPIETRIRCRCGAAAPTTERQRSIRTPSALSRRRRRVRSRSVITASRTGRSDEPSTWRHGTGISTTVRPAARARVINSMSNANRSVVQAPTVAASRSRRRSFTPHCGSLVSR